MSFKTAELCDEFETQIQAVTHALRDFGGKHKFSGPVVTLRATNSEPVRRLLASAGDGRVLVIDAKDARDLAVAGYRSAKLARDNGWSGIVVDGRIRDAADIRELSIGVKALGTSPRRGALGDNGEAHKLIEVFGIKCAPGDYLYADEDGIVIAAKALHR